MEALYLSFYEVRCCVSISRHRHWTRQITAVPQSSSAREERSAKHFGEPLTLDLTTNA